jgi:CheY-like chemotaxis protein
MATILLIEDDPRYSMMMLSMLESAGHSVRYAASGPQAMASFKAARPDLVITDLMMPKMDGLEMIGRLREMDELVPIIAMSGAGQQVLDAARERGAATTLAKPFNSARLIDAIAAAVAV